MSMNSIGDMAQAFAFRQRNAGLKQDIQRLSAELASGQTADIARHLGGSYAGLSGLERQTRIMEGYRLNQVEATQMTAAMQSALERIAAESETLAGDLVTGAQTGVEATRSALAEQARITFGSIVSALNSQAAGRNLFSGSAVDAAALAPASDMLNDIVAAVGTANTADDIALAIEGWFASGTGFGTSGYIGGDNALDPIRLGDGADVNVDIRADAVVLRNLLTAAASAAYVDFADPPLAPEEEAALLLHAGEALMTGQDDLVGLRAELGAAEARIDDWRTRTEAELTSLDYAKGTLLGIDPYETATQLEEAQFQLESLYAVTVRMSQLSLVNFLR